MPFSFRPMRFILPLLVLSGFFSLPVARADVVTIVGYDTTNPNGANGDPSPNLPAAESAAGVTALELARGPGLIANTGIAFNSRNWSTDATFSESSDRFISWGWSQSSRFNLTEMQIEYDRSQAGPEDILIRLSVNGGAFVDIFSDDFVEIDDEQHIIELDTFDDVISAEFRLYGFNANDAGGTFDIEQFQTNPSRGIEVRGELAAVPEPVSTGLLAGVFGLAAWSRSRRRKSNHTAI